MDILSGGLVLNLDSSGRSNEENISSRTSWISKGTEKATAVNFNNFNWYNNGWISDVYTDGSTALRLTNGASISIPITDIFNEPEGSNTTIDIEFKPRNVLEYARLITSEEYILTDENGKSHLNLADILTDPYSPDNIYVNTSNVSRVFISYTPIM